MPCIQSNAFITASDCRSHACPPCSTARGSCIRALDAADLPSSRGRRPGQYTAAVGGVARSMLRADLSKPHLASQIIGSAKRCLHNSGCFRQLQQTVFLSSVSVTLMAVEVNSTMSHLQVRVSFQYPPCMIESKQWVGHQMIFQVNHTLSISPRSVFTLTSICMLSGHISCCSHSGLLLKSCPLLLL